jgi:hypothetical protein
MLIRITKPEEKYSSRIRIMIGAVREILPDGKFRTACILGGKDTFGREIGAELHRWKYENPNDRTISIVSPLYSYEVFEPTQNPDECNLLAISYYMGTDYNDVIKTVDKKKFVVNERIIVSERIPNTYPEEYTKSRFNSILQYTGLEHLPKENPRYEGDCNSLIELSNECKYTMYKLVKVVTPEIK